jgi:hypothetical protein
MDFFRAFAGSRRNAIRDLDRLHVRRDGVRLAINAEAARLLRDQPDAAGAREKLVMHLTHLLASRGPNIPPARVTH